MLITPENWNKEIPEISDVYYPSNELWESSFEKKYIKREERKKYEGEKPHSHYNNKKPSVIDKYLQRMKKERNKENKKFYDALNRRSKTPPRRFPSFGRVTLDINNGGSSRHVSWNVEGN